MEWSCELRCREETIQRFLQLKYTFKWLSKRYSSQNGGKALHMLVRTCTDVAETVSHKYPIFRLLQLVLAQWWYILASLITI